MDNFIWKSVKKKNTYTCSHPRPTNVRTIVDLIPTIFHYVSDDTADGSSESILQFRDSRKNMWRKYLIIHITTLAKIRMVLGKENKIAK